MSYQALARKWRPKNFAEVVGQNHVVKALANALDQERLHHAYLFTGTRGVGKTTIARVFARCLNCEQGVGSTPCGECSVCQEIDEGRFIDLIEVDAASRTQVEDTRGLLDNVQYSPTSGNYKVYLIDEVHMLSKHSFNALLKTLEEPPPHVKFLLATTEPQKIPMTVLSRCLPFNLKRLPDDAITRQLEKIVQAENISFEQTALCALARAADGSMRDALSLLDQAIAHSDSSVTDTAVHEMLGTVPREYLHKLMLALADKDAVVAMQCTYELAQLSTDFNGLFEDIIHMLHQVALLQLVPNIRDTIDYDGEVVESLSKKLSSEDVQLFYQIALIGKRDMHLATSSHSALEMTLLRMLSFTPAAKDSCAVKKASAGGAKATEATHTQDEQAAKRAEVKKTVHVQVEQVAEQIEVKDLLDLDSSKEHWSRLIDKLSLQGVALHLALNCSVGKIENDSIVLNLAEQHEGLATESAKQKLEKALKMHFDKDLTLIIEFSSHEVATPAEKKEREAAKQQSQAEKDVEDDEVVKAFKSKFGAEVIQGSVKLVEK